MAGDGSGVFNGAGRTTGKPPGSPPCRPRSRGEAASAVGGSMRTSGVRKKESSKKALNSTPLAGAKLKGPLSSLFGSNKRKSHGEKGSGGNTEPLIGEDRKVFKPKKVLSRTLAMLVNPEQVITADRKAPRRSKRKAEEELERSETLWGV
jgi:hypothetical protein